MRKTDWMLLMQHGTYLFYIGGFFLAYTFLSAEGVQKDFFGLATGILLTLGSILIFEGIFRFCKGWLELSSLTPLYSKPKEEE